MAIEPASSLRERQRSDPERCPFTGSFPPFALRLDVSHRIRLISQRPPRQVRPCVPLSLSPQRAPGMTSALNLDPAMLRRLAFDRAEWAQDALRRYHAPASKLSQWAAMTPWGTVIPSFAAPSNPWTHTLFRASALECIFCRVRYLARSCAMVLPHCDALSRRA